MAVPTLLSLGDWEMRSGRNVFQADVPPAKPTSRVARAQQRSSSKPIRAAKRLAHLTGMVRRSVDIG